MTSALLLDYLEVNQKTTLSLLDTISYINNSNFLQIDDSTLKNLDIIYNFSQNYIFDLGGLLSYLSLIILLVFLTVQTFEKRRWS